MSGEGASGLERGPGQPERLRGADVTDSDAASEYTVGDESDLIDHQTSLAGALNSVDLRDNPHASPPRVPPVTAAGSAAAPRDVQNTPSYGDKEYWDARYENELAPGSDAPPNFDWYMGYSGTPLQTVLRAHVPPEAAILQVGVGASQLQREMVEDGYKLIMNIDNSAVVVEYMRALHEDIPQLSYHIADCRRMPQFDDASFGTVLDKGTLDAIMCGATADADVAAMVAEAYRVLEPGGCLVVVSFGQPSRRLSQLTTLPWPWQWVSVSAYGLRHQRPVPLPPPGGTEPLPSVIGPYSAEDAPEALNGLEVQDYYYVYLLRKSWAAAAPAAGSPHAGQPSLGQLPRRRDAGE